MVLGTLSYEYTLTNTYEYFSNHAYYIYIMSICLISKLIPILPYVS